MTDVFRKFYPVRTICGVLKLSLSLAFSHELFEMANERWSLNCGSAVLLSLSYKWLLLLAMLGSAHGTRVTVCNLRERALGAKTRQ